MASLDRIGPYQVVRELGRGGMGVVLEVRHPEIPRPLALKLLLQAGEGSGADDDEERRFAREMQLLAELGHPGIVRVHHAGRDERGRAYMVAELVPGQDLNRACREGPLEPRRAAEVARALADALAHVHARGIVHRDLKPGNVILTPEGRPVLLDFGLARAGHKERLTRTGALLGTPAYMAPEQVDGSDVGPAADVYGLGGVLFYLLCARQPFTGPPIAVLKQVLMEDPQWPSRTHPDTPRDLESICRQALAKDPAARYASAAALRDDLDRFLRGDPVEANPPALPRGLGRASLVVGAVGLLIVAGLAASVGVAVRALGSDAVPEAPPAPPPAVTSDAAVWSDAQEVMSRVDPGDYREALRPWLARHAAHPRADEVRAAIEAGLSWERPLWLHPAPRADARLVGDRLLVIEPGQLGLWSLPGDDLLEDPAQLAVHPVSGRTMDLAAVRGDRPWALRLVGESEAEGATSAVNRARGVALLELDEARRALVPGPELPLPDLDGLRPQRVAVWGGEGRRLVAVGGERQVGDARGGGWALLEIAGDGLRVRRQGRTVEPVSALAFSPDGARLAVGSGALIRFGEGQAARGSDMRENWLQLIDLSTLGDEPPRLFLAGQPTWIGFAAPPGGEPLILVTTTADEVVYAPLSLDERDRDVLRGRDARLDRSHQGTVSGGAVAGDLLVSGSGEGRELRRWSLSRRAQLGETLPLSDRRPTWLETDGRLLLLVYATGPERGPGVIGESRVELRLFPPGK